MKKYRVEIVPEAEEIIEDDNPIARIVKIFHTSEDYLSKL